jgi:hypothetical protein
MDVTNSFQILFTKPKDLCQYAATVTITYQDLLLKRYCVVFGEEYIIMDNLIPFKKMDWQVRERNFILGQDADLQDRILLNIQKVLSDSRLNIKEQVKLSTKESRRKYLRAKRREAAFHKKKAKEKVKTDYKKKKEKIISEIKGKKMAVKLILEHRRQEKALITKGQQIANTLTLEEKTALHEKRLIALNIQYAHLLTNPITIA